MNKHHGDKRCELGSREFDPIWRLVSHPSRDVRANAARMAAAELERGPDRGEAVLELLATDPDVVVRRAVAAGLRAWLEDADGFDRTQIVARWALSSQAHRRQVLALALQSDVSVVGAPSAITRLAEDRRSAVRQAAVGAAAVRLPRSRRRYQSILTSAHQDPDERVRGVADDAVRLREERGQRI